MDICGRHGPRPVEEEAPAQLGFGERAGIISARRTRRWALLGRVAKAGTVGPLIFICESQLGPHASGLSLELGKFVSSLFVRRSGLYKWAASNVIQ